MLCVCALVPIANHANLGTSVGKEVMRWSVIVPLLNEAANIPYLTEHLIESGADQVILVDGGSTDGTRELLQTVPSHFSVLYSDAGRARQMNAGAGKAIYPVMVFLHADSRLPKHVDQTLNRSADWGRFDIEFDDASISMRVIAFFINLRSRISGIATGDQALFMTRTAFDQVGGFPVQPLMEDIEISKRLKRLSKPLCSRQRVRTSARRWQQHGVVRTVLKMWWYRFAYWCGVSSHRLKRHYDDTR
jgi:rSAM/selenodomain-associated transferase 2